MAFTALKRLVPPAAFLTTLLDTREDLRKIREFLRELADWAAVQFTAIQAAIPSTAGGDLTGTYPNPNVAAIHETSGPTQLTIGSIAAGQYLQRVGTTIVGAASWNPYLPAPASPNAFNDEFDSGSADLGVRGWTFWNHTTNTTMTRNGDINPWGTNAVLGANQYNSRIVGTHLLLQMPIVASNAYSLYKAVTFPAGTTVNDGGTIWARFGHSISTDTVEHGYTNVFLALNAAGRPDPSNRVFAELKSQTGTFRYRRGVILAGVDTGADFSYNEAGPIHDIVGIRALATNTTRHFFVSSPHNQIFNLPSVTGITKANVAWAGIAFFVQAVPGSESQNAQLRSLDFLRLDTGSQNAMWLTS